MSTGKKIQIPDQLMKAISDRDCLFFIGAGFSIDAGLPGGRQIAEHLSNILKKNGISTNGEPLHKVAQHFEKTRGRPDLVREIRDLLGKAQKNADRKPYALLSKVGPQPVEIVTSNWDKLIEQEFGPDNVITIVNDSSIPTHSESKANLTKIHGDLDDLTSAVITTLDYARARNDNPGMYNRLDSLFRTNTILFIGYSVEDWDFLQMHEAIRSDLKGNTNPRYIATPPADEKTKLWFDSLGLIHIKAGAREFLSELLSELGPKEEGPSGLSSRHEKFPNPTIPSVIERNPFALFRAEDMSDEYWKKRLFVEPKLYNIFADAVSVGNVVIEGDRGSGKSMILLYLSYPIQRLLDRDPGFVGIYLKLTGPLLKGSDREEKDSQEWYNEYFLSYFNLAVTERVVCSVVDSLSNKWIEMETDKQAELVEKLIQLLPETGYKPLTLVDVADFLNQLRNKLAERRFNLRIAGDLIETAINRIKRYVPAWHDKAFYILLDEFENLDEDRQRIANTLVGSRPPNIYYKIAVRSFNLVPETMRGRPLDEPDDFISIDTDRFDFEQEMQKQLYPKFIQEIADHRLRIWEYDNSITSILPSGEKGFEDGEYSGFRNIVILSSYVPRDFLEMCKDMVFFANPGLFEGQKKTKLDPISPNLQNTVVSIHADNLLQNLHRVSDEGPRLRPRTRSENAMRIVLSWGRIFKTIVEKAKLKTGKKTVSEFIVKDYQQLSDEAVRALRDCVEQRVLRITLKRRRPLGKTGLPGDRYELHRLLCTRFGLSLGKRYPREVNAAWLNELLGTSDPRKIERIERKIVQHLLKREEASKYEKLDDYLDKTPEKAP